MIYKAFRARTLIFSYLSNDLFVQIRSIMGFYYILSKTTSNFYSLMLKFVRLSFVLLNSKAVLFLTKVNYLHKLSKRILKTI